MANYVLVHGGDRDGTIWEKVAYYLKQDGHQVFCPSMTSVTIASLDANIQEIVTCIESNDIKDCILVGHSYGSFVITGVTDKLPNKVTALVFVDALIPQDGQSLYDRAMHYNFDYEEYGLTLDTAVVSKIKFDATKVFQRPVAYIYCLSSEFKDLGRCSVDDAKSIYEDWLFFPLDAAHGCMFTHPKELAVIFNGMQLFI